ncbi:MAG TPA: metallopeptidase TldD-related protein, partial [Streptosporangiaceae bacterium]|nr:metallopeptidase TldD-related protein [Streptosporangiaceae bacterium]
RWAGNTLTTNGVTQSRALTVIAVRRRGNEAMAGVVSRSGVRDDQVEDVVREAERAADESSPAYDARPLVTPAGAGSAGAASGAGSAGAGSAGAGFSASWDDPVSRTEIGVFRRFTESLGHAFEAAAARDRKLYGFAEHDLTCSFLGTSSGLRLRHDQPSGTVEINGRSADLSRSAWAGQASRDFTDVDAAAMEASLAQRLGWASRQIELPAGRYETLLPPAAMADLMVSLYFSAGAKDALDGRTVFSKAGGGTRVGERLSSLPVTLRSDPAAPGLECAPFVIAHASSRGTSVFDNGLALRPSEWIRDGTLAALRQTRYSAELSDLPVTPGIDNLILEPASPGAPTLEDMLASTRRALLLTCLWYIREVDAQTLLLTGLTRDGVYLVEDGEVTAAVNNFRFNESPVGMLGRLAEVGRSAPALPREMGDFFSRVAMPPARIEGFNMSSVSQAS